MRIGIAGTGKMGSVIAMRLASLGHSVAVWNRTHARAQPLIDAGLAWASSPRALAADCELVISLLTNEQALDDVYGTDQGLFAAASSCVFVEMSTVRPAKQVDMARLAGQASAAYIECPVGGSVGPAKEGKLIGFVGGDAQVLDRARPILEQLCRRVEHVGAHGTGSTLKLAINLPLMVYWQTFAEALSLIEPLGLAPQRVVDIFSDSSGGPNMLKVRGPLIAQALAGEKNGAVTVNIATMRKDVRAMVDQGRVNERLLPLTELALRQLDAAAAAGLDNADCAQYPVWWLANGK